MFSSSKSFFVKNFGNLSRINKKRLTIFAMFTSGFGLAAFKFRGNKSEAIRLGLAGSLTNSTCELLFHFIDTVNVRAKSEKALNVSTTQLLKRIWQNEGIYGFLRGISATFYASIICGFIYFSFYKELKILLKKKFKFFQDKSKSPLRYMIASCISQSISLLIYYPYDLVKTRFQAKNHIFKYSSIVDAFTRISKQNGGFHPRYLYSGCLPYITALTINSSLQMTLYEILIDFMKSKRNQKETTKDVLLASALAGGISSFLTNCLEVIVVRKQINPKEPIKDIVKKEKMLLITKGLPPRVICNSFQAIVLFSCVHFFGNLFNVELADSM